MVTIQPHDLSDRYEVPKALLCSASDYFVKALSNSKESDERLLRLPGCGPDTLELFLYWLYHKQLPDSMGTGESTTTVNAIHELQLQLARAWCFGNAYLLPKLQNQAMLRLIEIMHRYRLSLGTIRYVFVNSPDEGHLRTVAAREAVVRHDCGGYTSDELDELGRIAGFFERFLQEQRDWRIGTWECSPSCRARGDCECETCRSDTTIYTVPE